MEEVESINLHPDARMQRVSDKIMWEAVSKLPKSRKRWGHLYLVRVAENGSVYVSRLEPPRTK